MPPGGSQSITVQVRLLLLAICKHASAATSQITPSPLFDCLDITRLRLAGTCSTTPHCWRPRPSSACRCGLHQCMAASNAGTFLWVSCACTLFYSQHGSVGAQLTGGRRGCHTRHEVQEKDKKKAEIEALFELPGGVRGFLTGAALPGRLHDEHLVSAAAESCSRMSTSVSAARPWDLLSWRSCRGAAASVF